MNLIISLTKIPKTMFEIITGALVLSAGIAAYIAAHYDNATKDIFNRIK